MKKVVIGGVVVGIALLLILVLRIIISDTTEGTDFAYHVLLADPEIYEEGVYMEKFEIPAGSYKFRFVPNGDSPQVLRISLEGDGFSFFESFELEGTSHKTPISEYYTWDYLGEKGFDVPAGQVVDIVIDPDGDTAGSVSVIIVRI